MIFRFLQASLVLVLIAGCAHSSKQGPSRSTASTYEKAYDLTEKDFGGIEPALVELDLVNEIRTRYKGLQILGIKARLADEKYRRYEFEVTIDRGEGHTIKYSGESSPRPVPTKY